MPQPLPGPATQVVVITGSTRGIGYGLAEAFLHRGCRVIVSSRTEEAVAHAAGQLAAAHDASRIVGQPCDVTDWTQVQRLWDAAVARFGRVDIWINNAGVGHAQTDVWEFDPDLIATVVETNLVGAMYGARVALDGMRRQGFGALYNMEGLGSGGPYIKGLALYSTTKHGLAYLTDALVKETEDTPIVVGALRPGMVVTDLLMAQYETRPEAWERARGVFEVLADRVETVAPWMADRILANKRSGVRFNWLNRLRVAVRFLTAPFRKRDLFTEPPS
jgi:NAD(P)-dependent dehydrogenase (short-subunit alcohol dehydrogenase family)